MKNIPERILITKIGLDGHDRGSRIVAAYLRDAGMEVIYTPPWQAIEAVVMMALQEDIDVIGLSSLATDHLIVPELMILLRDQKLHHVRVIIGGVIPEQEQGMLLDSGVSYIFQPGAKREEIVEHVKGLAAEARTARDLSLGGYENE